jgi:hypothetical protein
MTRRVNMQGFDVTALTGTEELLAWVPFNDDVTVQVRHVSREELAGILRQATVVSFDNKHQKQTEIDNLKYGELLGLAAIKDWKGLVTGTAEFPCTPENIRILMRKWADFAKFISDLSSDLERLVQAEKETERKN